MSHYQRSTKECTLAELRPELLEAIRSYLLKHGLSEIEAQIDMCCETVSKRQKQSALAALLGEEADQIYYTGVFITPQWLVWAHSGDKTGTTVISAQLTEIRAKPIASILARDAGLEVSGYVGGSNTQVRGYLGMGAEEAAQKFCALVKQATDTANPSRSLLDAFSFKRR
jgi:hypothetical protein